MGGCPPTYLTYTYVGMCPAESGIGDMMRKGDTGKFRFRRPKEEKLPVYRACIQVCTYISGSEESVFANSDASRYIPYQNIVF